MKTTAALSGVILTAAAFPSVFKRAYVSTLGSELPDDFAMQVMHPPAGFLDDNDKARKRSGPSKRAAVDNSCGDQQQFVQSAVALCARRAQKAAAAAQDPSTSQLMLEFFKNDDEQTRSRVASVLQGVAADCGSPNGGERTNIGCGQNGGRFYGVTHFGGGLPNPEMQLFPEFFNLAQQPVSCGHLDAGSMIVHEMTHADAHTDDFGSSYGLQVIASLSPQQNINHADTYAYFAQAVDIGCGVEDLRRGGAPSGTPAQDSPDGNSPNGNSPNGNSPNGNSPNRNSPNRNSPNGETNDGETETPTGNSPIGNSPTGNSPTGDSPFGNSPPGNSPFDNPRNGNRQNGNRQNGNLQNGNLQNGNLQNGNLQNGNFPTGNSPFDNSRNGNLQSGNSPFANSPNGNLQTSGIESSPPQDPAAQANQEQQPSPEQNNQEAPSSALPNWVNDIVSYVVQKTK
ncbi:hypothetical protein CDD81_4115 [Ophiocordyceps australis]|uniref:deuterolysin n=1 Tax=Ophiocordyceps australis TaxID=1399860 RepID=A0A2C5YCI7_9HYPO|nr:hypothetical protein CDD81_4115 [Ophiocordyceps australis]